MKRSALKRWGLVTVAMTLLACQAAFAQYKFKVISTTADYGGGQLQIGDLNNKGQFSWNNYGTPTKDNPDEAAEVMYFWDGTAVSRIQPSSTKLSDGSALISTSMWTPQGVNDLGHVGYVADTDKSPHAIVIWDSNTKQYTMVSNQDTVVEGGKLTSGGVALGRMAADLNNTDQVAWSEGLEPTGGGDANDAVFVWDPATKKITTVARKGTALPGGKQILNAVFPDINDAGEVVFMANTADNDTFGVYQWAAGNITAICAPGTKVGDITVAQAKFARNSNGGHVVFRGETTSSGAAAPVADDTGFFIYTAATGKIEKIAVPGDTLPGGKMVSTEGNRRAIAVNKNGLVAFKAVLEGEVQGIFLWQGGTITKLVTSGETLESSFKLDGIVQGLGGQSGYNLGINEFGDVAFSAVSGETHAVILATAPR